MLAASLLMNIESRILFSLFCDIFTKESNGTLSIQFKSFSLCYLLQVEQMALWSLRTSSDISNSWQFGRFHISYNDSDNFGATLVLWGFIDFNWEDTIVGEIRLDIFKRFLINSNYVFYCVPNFIQKICCRIYQVLLHQH